MAVMAIASCLSLDSWFTAAQICIRLPGCVCLSLQVVEELLKAGPAVNAIDADGCSALHLAAQDGHLEVSILLFTPWKGQDP